MSLNSINKNNDQRKQNDEEALQKHATNTTTTVTTPEKHLTTPIVLTDENVDNENYGVEKSQEQESSIIQQ